MSFGNNIADNRHYIREVIMATMVIIVVLAAYATAFGQNDWKAEFDDICSKTDQALTLSKEEISVLIERCDKLKPRIEQLEETEKKVSLRRLQLCRNLFAYVLESLKNK